MPYKDKEKQRQAIREAVRRKRYGITQPIVIPVIPEDVIPKTVIPKNVMPNTEVSAKTFGYATKSVPSPAWMKPV